jgi:molybdopterin synthase sulfur carrier subunit
MIRLVFLGKLADLAGCETLEVASPTAGTRWPELVNALPSKLAEGLDAETTKVALNGTLVADRTAMVARNGDEVAFLPPVSGG